jgi:hypothetical protein
LAKRFFLRADLSLRPLKCRLICPDPNYGEHSWFVGFEFRKQDLSTFNKFLFAEFICPRRGSTDKTRLCHSLHSKAPPPPTDRASRSVKPTDAIPSKTDFPAEQNASRRRVQTRIDPAEQNLRSGYQIMTVRFTASSRSSLVGFTGI